MPVPESTEEPGAEASLASGAAAGKSEEKQAVAEDLEARATFAGRPSVASLRRARKKASFDTVGGAALLVCFTWPFVQAVASGTAGGLFAGIVGGVVFLFASAIASGLVEAAWSGARATSLAFLLVSMLAGIYWLSALPPWGLGVMGAAVLGGLATTWRLESKRLKGGLEISEPLLEAVLALPEHMPKALQAGVDAAVTAHQQLHRSLATLDDVAQRHLIGRTADDALNAFIRQTRRQVELEGVFEGDERATLEALRDEGRGQLAEITRQIKDLREALLILLVRHDPGATASLADRIEHLRLTAQALDEIKREGA